MIEGLPVQEQWDVAVTALWESCLRANLDKASDQFVTASLAMFAGACVHAVLAHPEWALATRLRFMRETNGRLPSVAAVQLAQQFMLDCPVERTEV